MEGPFWCLSKIFRDVHCTSIIYEAMNREIESIDSEFARVLQDDYTRLKQLQQYTSTPGHLMNIFSWGNKKSLTKVLEDNPDARERLMKIHRDHYCAESMNLVVIGGHSLDILERWVCELFSRIKKTSHVKLQTSTERRIWNGGKVWKSKALTLTNLHILELSWELPSLAKDYLMKAWPW